MGMPTETEREWRSGRYKGVRIPFSLQPVDDPAHSEGLRWFREGVDAALDSVQEPVIRTVRYTVPVPPDTAMRLSRVIKPGRCSAHTVHGTHYWQDGAVPRYCEGGRG